MLFVFQPCPSHKKSFNDHAVSPQNYFKSIINTCDEIIQQKTLLHKNTSKTEVCVYVLFCFEMLFEINLLASKIIFTGNNKKIQLRFITNEQKTEQFKVDSIILVSFFANFEKIWHIGQEWLMLTQTTFRVVLVTACNIMWEKMRYWKSAKLHE